MVSCDESFVSYFRAIDRDCLQSNQQLYIDFDNLQRLISEALNFEWKLQLFQITLIVF